MRNQLDRTRENITRAVALLGADTAPRGRDHLERVGESPRPRWCNRAADMGAQLEADELQPC